MAVTKDLNLRKAEPKNGFRRMLVGLALGKGGI